MMGETNNKHLNFLKLFLDYILIYYTSKFVVIASNFGPSKKCAQVYYMPTESKKSLCISSATCQPHASLVAEDYDAFKLLTYMQSLPQFIAK